MLKNEEFPIEINNHPRAHKQYEIMQMISVGYIIFLEVSD